jgi:hypothetical protein
LSAGRLEAARERLAEALRTGADTGPHRAAIRQLEEAARAAAEQASQAQQATDERAVQAMHTAVEARTAEIVAQTLHEVALAVASFNHQDR